MGRPLPDADRSSGKIGSGSTRNTAPDAVRGSRRDAALPSEEVSVGNRLSVASVGMHDEAKCLGP